jgi:hypothetical protein
MTERPVPRSKEGIFLKTCSLSVSILDFFGDGGDGLQSDLRGPFSHAGFSELRSVLNADDRSPVTYDAEPRLPLPLAST